MKRHYFVRDRRIEVEEMEDVVAVRLAADRSAEPGELPSSLGEPARTELVEEASDRAREDFEAFERADWVLVSPSPETRASLDARTELPDAEEVGKLIRRGDGSVAIDVSLLNVQLDPDLGDAESRAILAEVGLEVINQLRFAPNLYETRATGFADAIEASQQLHDDERFVFAEPAFIEHIPQRAIPTDPDYPQQWQWNNDGSNGGTVGADVRAEAAWDVTRGAGIRVAVIDNGFDADHEDLAAGVVPESGFYSAGTRPTFTQGTAGMPDSNHGTFCAGMVGARWNNGRGGVGGAPDCELMLVACLNDQIGTQTTLARAVAYAADPSMEVAGEDPANGADIIVSSLGPNGADWALTATLGLALAGAAGNGRGGRGVCIFWAASNGSNVDVTRDEVVSHDDVIAVVRSDRSDLEDNAARGPTVELIAPGVDVFSTRSGDAYGTSTGTSFAAPCAASCAALALSVAPSLTRDQLRQAMRDTADQIGGVVYDAAGHNDDYGFGRVNAESAVREAVRLANAWLQPVLHVMMR